MVKEPDKPLLISLSISAEEYLRVYQGTAKTVSALDDYGRRIRFPVNILQPYVSHEGIHGVFAIYVDEENRFKRVERLS